MKNRAIHGGAPHDHQCPDLQDHPASVDVETYDCRATDQDGILLLADLYVAGRASRSLLEQRLSRAWQDKQWGQWVDIEVTRRMFRDVGFTFDESPVPRPRHDLTLFRAAPPATRHGVSWTTCPDRAAGIGAYHEASDARKQVWTVVVPPARLLAFHTFEKEFILECMDTKTGFTRTTGAVHIGGRCGDAHVGSSPSTRTFVPPICGRTDRQLSGDGG